VESVDRWSVKTRLNMKDFRHLLCGNLTGQVGQIRSYGSPSLALLV
jgi:hypothetical protein